MSNYNCWCDNDERRRLTTMLTTRRCLLHAMNFYYCCFLKIGKKNIGLEMTNNFKIEDRLSKIKSSLKSICVNIWFKWSSLVPINGFVCIDSWIQNKTLNLISFFEATNYLLHFIYFCSHEICHLEWNCHLEYQFLFFTIQKWL